MGVEHDHQLGEDTMAQDHHAQKEFDALAPLNMHLMVIISYSRKDRRSQ